MKVIFLDVDGVLCTEAVRFRYPELDPAPVAVLNALLQRTGARIVVSSTWRHPNAVARNRELLGGPGRIEPVDRIIGATPGLTYRDPSLKRGHEIQAWLDQYAPLRRIDGIAIVDDDTDMVHLAPYLVQTNSRAGLTAADAIEVERMLTRPWPLDSRTAP